MPTLIVLQGPDKGKTLTADDDRILIGRGSEQVPLSDQTISRRHAELRRADGDWILVDLNSANGTYVNGVRTDRPVRLKRGDQIRLGSTLLVYAGHEKIEQFSGRSIPQDLVALDVGSRSVDSAIVASTPSSEDSLVLAAPETAQAVRAWNVMRELAGVLGSLLSPEALLHRILDIIFRHVDVERAVVLMRDAETGEFLPEVVRFRHPLPPTQVAPGPIIASRTIINHVVGSREGVLCSNVVTDQRFGSGKSAQSIGMSSVICAPVAARDHILGVIHLDCPVTRHTYDEQELKLITAIGYQAGLALENAQLVQAHLRQERLAAAGETVAYLSHYIKNILQGMRSGADVLQRGLEKSDLKLVANGWRLVERNLDRSYNLMLNMLAFSKPRQPRLELFQINRIVEEVVALVQKQADEVQAALLTDLDDGLPPIPVDREGVHQIVLNLVTNAIEAVPRGRGVVSVRTTFDSGRQEAAIRVSDNGPGVPPQQRHRIFEPFHSTKGHAGTGLGLAAARKIAQEMGGSVELLPAAGGGAEFEVRLPVTAGRPRDAGDTHGPAG